MPDLIRVVDDIDPQNAFITSTDLVIKITNEKEKTFIKEVLSQPGFSHIYPFLIHKLYEEYKGDQKQVLNKLSKTFAQNMLVILNHFNFEGSTLTTLFIDLYRHQFQ